MKFKKIFEDDIIIDDLIKNTDIEIAECTDLDIISNIKAQMGKSVSRFHRLFVVRNNKTEQAFTNFIHANQNCKPVLFFHGSPTKNWESILKQGLVLSKITHGTIIGNGIYGAITADKALNYSSMVRNDFLKFNQNFKKINYGYIALFAFAIDENNKVDYFPGESDSMSDIKNWDIFHKRYPNATYTLLHANKYYSQDIVAVYREDQVTIRYLIECK